MKQKKQNEEDATRLQKLLAGAFSGPPTPLKDIPTREGEFRKKRPKAASSASAKSASQRKKNRA
jgi:hypothetical protein